MNYSLFSAITGITLRADKSDRKALFDTFVDVGTLMPMLSSNNSHVLYGRRGTGKTHVLEYLCSTYEDRGDCAVFVDMRTVGSSCSIYSDENIPIQQRVIRLIIDVFKEINNQIIDYITANNERKESYLHQITPIIDNINESICSIKIEGDESLEIASEKENAESSACKFGVNLKTASLAMEDTDNHRTKSTSRHTISGKSSSYVHFPTVTTFYNKIMKILKDVRLLVILDEYSEIPEKLQPLLADMLRRSLVAVRNIIIKIGAIEHRTFLKLQLSPSSYLGLEIGADCSSLNLDEYMVFNSNREQSLNFFKQLLFKHINNELPVQDRYDDPDAMIDDIFTSSDAFAEWVRSAEGVPRDGFNILNFAVQTVTNSKISLPAIRSASKKWYDQDKASSLNSYPMASDLMYWIVDKVIGQRHARAFLLESNAKDKLIDYLFDSRVLHIIKTNISSKDAPGLRYDVYAIDYGCYCDLANTNRSPKCLFEADDDDNENVAVQVPQDDYRSIRRAKLEIGMFYKTHHSK